MNGLWLSIQLGTNSYFSEGFKPPTSKYIEYIWHIEYVYYVCVYYIYIYTFSGFEMMFMYDHNIYIVETQHEMQIEKTISRLNP